MSKEKEIKEAVQAISDSIDDNIASNKFTPGQALEIMQEVEDKVTSTIEGLESDIESEAEDEEDEQT